MVINLRKEKYAVMRGSFTSEGIRDFLHDLVMGGGKVSLSPINSLPDIKPSTAWDGKDAPVITHVHFALILVFLVGGFIEELFEFVWSLSSSRLV